ncbi:hypothetical protein [Streptomyces sp. NBC_00690]|uniref:hypothetical protein n=1 Tax=Streptomyces sp. NBC_00690 TaxID=2975808 RepID=UPI002E2AE359|nr:hypothetical protein [Streptomyces sp. NBC_00690]
MPSDDETMREIEFKHGPFGQAITKPFASTRRAVDERFLLKVYIGIDPEGRRKREVETVQRAAHWGLSVPEVLATGTGEDGSWTVFRIS